MARSRKLYATGALGVAAFALIAAGAGSTGAYFSDTKTGDIKGTIGAVKVTTSATTFTWTNMMPGEPKTASVDFVNEGSGNQDFYLTFPNATALSALNSLGEYGEAHISVNGVEKFASKNLNDGYACGTPGNTGVATLCPVPAKLLLASDVGVGAPNNFKFTFNYAGKLKSPAVAITNAPFNKFPVLKADGSKDQTTVINGETGNGLPFAVVAVQVGQQP